MYGGAILINDQKLPITTEPETAGLTYVIKADNLEAARTFFEQDPWFKAGAVSDFVEIVALVAERCGGSSVR